VQDASAQIIQDQIAYYRARANEYDEWFLRQGRYDHGPEWRQQWLAEVHEVQQRSTRSGLGETCWSWRRGPDGGPSSSHDTQTGSLR